MKNNRGNNLISVIVCAHNEEQYVDTCLPSIVKAVSKYPHQIIIVADRCTDKTVEKCKRYEVRIIEKDYRKWRNSYAESLQLGLKYATGKYMAIVDMDVIIPPNFFDILLPLIRNDVASVSPWVVTYPSGLLNKVISAWEKTYMFAPVGKGTYGMRIVLKKAFNEINGFRDVLAVDTDLDLRLRRKGFDSIFTPLVKIYHMRRETWRSLIKKQIRAGQARRMIKYGLLKTLGHAIFRLRPFVMVGWIIGGGERK